MKNRTYKLSAAIQKILVALANALITKPVDCVIQDQDNALLKRAEALIREFPKLFRYTFTFGLHLFDHLTFFFGFGTKKFTSLPLPQQQKYIESWMGSRFTFVREMFKGFRGIIMICFFSHPDVYDYIGYHPGEHATQKIKLRQELLKKP